jgi:polysaccharide export outer membrane protein
MHSNPTEAPINRATAKEFKAEIRSRAINFRLRLNPIRPLKSIWAPLRSAICIHKFAKSSARSYPTGAPATAVREVSARRHDARLAIFGTFALSLVGCNTVPTAGPTTNEVITQAAKNGQQQFELVNIDRRVLDVLVAQPVISFHSRFAGFGPPPEQRISVGDTIGVTIWQAVDANAASQTPSGGVGQPAGAPTSSSALPEIVVPDQLVMRNGTIVLPSVGQLRVVGLSTAQAEAAIKGRLEDQLIKPQVIVSINKSDANTVTISGEGATASRVPLSPRGTRLLEAIAGAGGAKTPTSPLVVRLTRGTVTATIPYDALVADSADNIYVYPGDIITLSLAAPTFDAFGAAGKPMQYAWNASDLTLTQALGLTSGLDDAKADPAGVFLMRYEPSSLVRQLVATPTVAPDKQGLVPVIFRLDLSDANSYLLAQRFAMRDKDAIYVADTQYGLLSKLVYLVTNASYPFITAAAITR